MAWRLGLDVGTNSIGWAAWKLESREEELVPSELMKLGVRIFSEGRNPKDNTPLAVARREARAMRRRRDRRKRQMRKLVTILVNQGLFPNNPEERQALKRLNPIELRNRAATVPLSAFELGRALYHLALRRGFQSNRKDADTKENTETKQRMGALAGILDEAQKTLGQWLFAQSQTEAIRFRPGTSYYPTRDLSRNEFDRIVVIQKDTFPNVDWRQIRTHIFFQRPLQPKERGRCSFYPEEFRAFKAQPTFQRFRYRQKLADLRILAERNQELPLTPAQEAIVVVLLESNREVKFSTIRTALKVSARFNLEDQEKLPGNRTSVVLGSPEAFGTVWVSLDLDTQDRIVERLLGHEEDEALANWLAKEFPKLSDDQMANILKKSGALESGTAALSLKMMKPCLQLMEEGHLTYTEAAKVVFGDHQGAKPIELATKLPYYGEILTSAVLGQDPRKNPETDAEGHFGKIPNPTVHIALNQLRKVYQALADRWGAPSQIVLELSRDLPLGEKSRSEEDSRMKKNRAENEIIRDRIYAMAPGIPRDRIPMADVRKFKLWEELNEDPNNRCCLYCGGKISPTDLFSTTGAVELEHILPFSRTLSDSVHNLTVSHKRCNQIKGNQTPWEAFGTSPAGFSWDGIEHRIGRLKNLIKRKNFRSNAMDDFQREGKDFVARALNDGRYIAKVTRAYLASVVPENKIWVLAGRMTSDLRRAWNLNSLLSCSEDPNFKNRTDHRHHALDAAVIGLVDRRLVKHWADANQKEDEGRKHAPFAFPLLPNEVVDALNKIVVSHKADHGTGGRFFQETAYGKRSYVVVHSLVEVATFSAAEWTEKRSPISQLIRDLVPQLLVEKPHDLKTWLEAHGYRRDEIAFNETFWVSRMPVEAVTDDNAIRSILEPRCRHDLQDLFSKHGKGKAFETARDAWAKARGVRNLRYRPKNQEYVSLPRLNPYKGYQNDDFVCVEIWKTITGKGIRYTGHFIARWQVARYKDEETLDRDKLQRRPSREAKYVGRLYKQDVIELNVDDERGVSRKIRALVKGYSTTQNKFDIYPISAADLLTSWIKNTNKNLVDPFWRPKDSQNFLSINIAFGELKARIINNPSVL